jgi:hypothetical protein
MQKLTWPQITAWRLRRHHLDQRLPAAGRGSLTGSPRSLSSHSSRQVLSSASKRAAALGVLLVDSV